MLPGLSTQPPPMGVRRRRFYSLLPAFALVCSALLLALATACNPSERPIVFTSDRDGNLEVYSVRDNGLDETNLTNSTADEFSPVVSPNGMLIAFQSRSGAGSAMEVMRVDGSKRVQVTKGSAAYSSQRWSPDGDRFAYIQKGPPDAAYVAAVEGPQSARLASIPADEVGDWSGDGVSVVFAVRSGENTGLWVRNPDGVNEFRLTETPDYGAVWSPDSRRIAFLSTRDGNPELYVMDADGTNQKRLTSTDADEYYLSWSPDGKRLLFVSGRDGNPEIYVLGVEEAEATRLTFNSVRDDQPVWSPDGRRIAFASYLDGDGEIIVMEAGGQNQVRLTSNDADDTAPSW